MKEKKTKKIYQKRNPRKRKTKYLFLPQPFIAPPNLNPLAPIPVAVADDEAAMAEERTLLPSQFGGGPDEDPAEFWRRLDNYMTYKKNFGGRR